MDKTIRLIIADDNPHVRHGLKAILTSHPGIEVVGEASQGEQAISMVEEKHPDVALMDIRMPVLNGLKATKRMKDRWQSLRVVLISMYADYQAQALESGADAFLVKGCSSEELITAIKGKQTQTEIIPA